MSPGAMSPAFAGCLKAEVAEMVKKLMNHICCGFTVTAVIALLIFAGLIWLVFR